MTLLLAPLNVIFSVSAEAFGHKMGKNEFSFFAEQLVGHDE
jgi:hypothetical protein